jgi:hypothetical protein
VRRRRGEQHPSECPLDRMLRAAFEFLNVVAPRDLTSEEIARVCQLELASWTDEEQQRKAEEAHAGAREEERMEYVRRQRKFLRLTRGER